MPRTVAHFIRKSTHLKASFIQNQITHHDRYRPVIVFKYEAKKMDGGFAEFTNTNFATLNLWKQQNFWARFQYQYPRLVTAKDAGQIEDFLTEHKVSILHFHYGTDAGLYYPFLKKSTLPSVVSFYGYDCSGFPKRLFGYGRWYLKNRVFPFIDKVLAMSNDMKNDLLAVGCPEEKIIVHYYGSDVKRFFLKKHYNNRSSDIRFLIISGLEPQKGHFFLLEAFQKAYFQNHSIRLDIFGWGQLKDKLHQHIVKNNLASFVKMHGPVVYASGKHLEQLRKADVFIHPSVTDTNGDKEGIPGAIIEAMAAGLPVISTFHAGIPFIIQNGKTGMLVDEWDIDALVDAILKLAGNVEQRRRLGHAGQDYAIKYLDLFQKEQELEQIYDGLI